jgi:hypothetical protein
MVKMNIKNKVGDSLLKIGIKRAGEFNWKPTPVAHWDSATDLRYRDDAYDAVHFMYCHYLQIFWLGYIIYFEIGKKKTSTGRYVNYNDTHFALMDKAKKS